METQELRMAASIFLKEHGRPGYAKMIKRSCAYHVTRSLLKRYGKKELLRLYPHMFKELKRGFLYWFPPITTRLMNILNRIDREHRYGRERWLRFGEFRSEAEGEDYFKKLEDAVLTWLTGG